MILEKIAVGSMQVNCYILGCPRTARAMVIDPGDEPEKIKARLELYNLKVNYVVNTHGHLDHTAADRAFSAPVCIHRLDAEFMENPDLNLSAMFATPVVLPAADKLLEDGQVLKAGGISLKVIHTPGHTPGGICLKGPNFCFTGDTLFAQGVGRCDFARSDEKLLFNSIREKLLTLPDETVIYPGHGPASTIGREKENLARY